MVNLTREREGVVIEVTDTGRGIPSESLPHMFDRFYRVPDGEGLVSGTGLGLAIAKKIAENHNGSISVSSVLDEGTTFEVWLPA